jgi:hypothetical protein
MRVLPSRKLPKDEEKLKELRKKHNPNNEATGLYTGRCADCGSDDLWDDATAYGCNVCDETVLTG